MYKQWKHTPTKNTLLGHGGYDEVPKQKRPEWATYANEDIKPQKFTIKQRQQALNAYQTALIKEAEKIKAEQDKYKTAKQPRLVDFDIKDKNVIQRQVIESAEPIKTPCIQKNDFTIYLSEGLLILNFRGQQYTYKRRNKPMLKRLRTTLTQFSRKIIRANLPVSKARFVHEILEMHKTKGAKYINYKKQKLLNRPK